HRLQRPTLLPYTTLFRSKVWSTVSHLNAVNNTPQIREAYEKCQPRITEYYTEMGQNRELFEAIGRLAARTNELQLDPSQRKILRSEEHTSELQSRENLVC